MKEMMSRETLTTFAGLPLLVMVFVFTVYRPGETVRSALRTEITREYSSTQEIPRRVAGLDSLKGQIAQRNRVLAQHGFIISDSADQHAVLLGVSELAKRSQITITRREPSEPIRSRTYHTVPFHLTVQGEFTGLAQFLYGLETSPRHFAFREISLKRENGESGAVIQAEIDFSVYVYSDELSHSTDNNSSFTTSAVDRHR